MNKLLVSLTLSMLGLAMQVSAVSLTVNNQTDVELAVKIENSDAHDQDSTTIEAHATKVFDLEQGGYILDWTHQLGEITESAKCASVIVLILEAASTVTIAPSDLASHKQALEKLIASKQEDKKEVVAESGEGVFEDQ